MYATANEACKHFNICYKTLDRWANSGKIKFVKTLGGQRRFIINEQIHQIQRINIIYARVSSRKQRDDLNRQVSYITSKIPDTRVITDIGSGFNYNRKGFQSIIKQVIGFKIDTIYVSYPDRFTRLSFDFFKWLFKQFGTKLVSLSKPNITQNSNKEEFADDLIGIITYYTAKFYGKRKYITKYDSTTNSSIKIRDISK